MTVLATDRLLLSCRSSDAAAVVLAYLERNRVFFAPWTPRASAAYFTIAGQQQRLDEDTHLQAAGSSVRFWMTLRAAALEGPIIGDIGLSNIIRGAFQSCHVGYKIDAAYAGQGLMTEALRAVITFAFDRLLLHRLEANIMPRNTPSRRVVEKLGFVNEGLSPRYLKINAVWEDHLHYVLLNPHDDDSDSPGLPDAPASGPAEGLSQ